MSEQAPDVAAWLAHPLTVGWIDYLTAQADVHRRALPGIVANGHEDQARALAGAIKAYEDILTALQPDAIVEDKSPEMPFIDPAERPSLRKK